MIGKEIHHYKILEKLGEEGMGVVYKAQDTKLDRVVALKFLPTHSLGNDDDRKRFETEAKAAAALNHPNIATVYEINDHEGDTFIAMEFVDGDTLEDKIKKAPLKIKEAMKIAKQVADGLAAAHEKDIFHRDIKGSNVMVTAKGVVKIMDFGLAKMSSATVVTKAGMTLGTVGYMSPEQSKGEVVDHRTDIWSLGVVYYEMIAGVRPFKGEYETALVYSILNVDPEPLTGLRTGVPMDLEKIINKLLAKDPDERYQNVIELPVDLKNVDLKEVGTSRIGSSVITQSIVQDKKVDLKVSFSTRNALLVGVTALVVFALTWILKPEPTSEPRPLKRSVVLVDEELGIEVTDTRNRMAISPDGQNIVYISPASRGNQLNLYDMRTAETFTLEGTAEAWNPFFSPDGRWIGYYDALGVKKVTVDGGTPLEVSQHTVGAPTLGGAWGSDNMILFGVTNTMYRLSATSGTPEQLFSLDDQDHVVEFPSILPGGAGILFTVRTGPLLADNRIALYLFEADTYRILIDEEGYNAVYSLSGHIVYGRSGVIMAVAFDLGSLEITGDPVIALENVMTHAVVGGMNFALADDGTVAYVDGSTNILVEENLISVDRDGKSTVFSEQLYNYRYPRFSPDGSMIAVEIINAGGTNIWTIDIENNIFNQLTNSDQDFGPVWSPDGEDIYFRTNRDSSTNSVNYIPVDGSRAATKLFDTAGSINAIEWSNDGEHLLYYEVVGGNARDIYIYSVKDETSTPVIATVANERAPRFSPDNKWIVYVSDASGQDEIYVKSFPPTSGETQISIDGGTEPVWSPQGNEIFYRKLDEMRSVSISTNPAVRILKREILFEEQFETTTFRAAYDVHPNGESFLMVKGTGANVTPNINVIVNWFEELKRLAPVKKE